MPFVLPIPAATALTPQAEAFVRRDLGLTRYDVASVDLNADRRAELLVRATDPAHCGSGGCTLFVLTPTNRGYRIVTRMTLTRPPVRLLRSSSNGWRDLAVRVAGGGIPTPRDVRLRFDGRSYPSNPSVVPTTIVARPADRPLLR